MLLERVDIQGETQVAAGTRHEPVNYFHILQWALYVQNALAQFVPAWTTRECCFDFEPLAYVSFQRVAAQMFCASIGRAPTRKYCPRCECAMWFW